MPEIAIIAISAYDCRNNPNARNKYLMRKIKRPLLYVLVLVGGLLFVGDIARAATSAEKSLEKGIEAYRKNDTDKAMDYFVDVLMNGTAAQQARANNYIDAIHNKIGGIETPVEVDLTFPDQPTQTVVDPVTNMANYGTERLNTLATEGEQAIQETAEALNQVPQTLTEQIEARQLAGYALDENGQPTALDEFVAPVQNAQPVQTVAPVQMGTPVQDTTAAQTQEYLIPTQQELDELNDPLAPREHFMTTTSAAPVVYTQQPTAVAAAPAPYVQAAPVQTTSSTFADLTSDEAIRARNLYTAQKLQSMTDEVVEALKNTPGVHLYMRDDGRPDAIDIDKDKLFNGNYFRADSLDTLNYVYELLALTQGASYTILPAGSYTDDVTLAGIRQAMALKSYLVKRGISQGKLSYNMGLVDEEVPAKFSNLQGLSVVFDYDAKLPTRLIDNEEKSTEPLLSMAIVPPCRAIDRALGEAFAIDFSVLETVTPLDNWMLQVILHGRDGKYYVVRQLEGFSPVYHQILWNGRKGIIGPELPCGKYTIVLTGVDLKGQKQVLRRRVIVKCVEEKPTTGSCQEGKCPVVAETSSAKTMAKSTVLNYKSSRLWKKPGRMMRDGTVEETAVVNEDHSAEVTASAEEHGSAQSTEDSTYTHTKTVRTIVTTDNTPAETVSSSYTSDVSNSVVTNPYEMPYEEEYSSSTTSSAY